MDAISVITNTTSTMNLKNGAHGLYPSSNIEIIVSPHEGHGSIKRDEQSDGISGSTNQLRKVELINSSEEDKLVTISHSESIRKPFCQDDQSDNSKTAKSQWKNKKISSGNGNLQTTVPTSAKKNGDRTQAEKGPVVLNGSFRSSSRHKQLAQVTNQDTINDRHTINAMEAGKKQSGNIIGASAAYTSMLEDPIEKRKNMKPLKQHTSIKVEEHSRNTLSPTHAISKARQMGSSPSYGFTFKCEERAEKRKEFYSKLEEKTHAKELEQSSLQEKTKETQEAELKLFRKSLTFKATPMPSFYQEPAPPKVEFKKIPPTRAKSPKLGRCKGSSAQDVEVNSINRHPTRRSLDNKNSQNSLTKDSIVHSKKNQRRPLPILPSKKTDLVDAAGKSPPHMQQLENPSSNTMPVEEEIQFKASPDEPQVMEERPIVQEPLAELA
ncbi:Protein WVD2-like 1 [Ananas comosus]|uniref:Protein WVD2-like 1 n=1 Tax=Ananas comosus TaxID=4615 RepID=A0A199V5A1_ANACO|nr:Protein WVD2-like 1 [Ananas comosus]